MCGAWIARAGRCRARNRLLSRTKSASDRTRARAGSVLRSYETNSDRVAAELVLAIRDLSPLSRRGNAEMPWTSARTGMVRSRRNAPSAAGTQTQSARSREEIAFVRRSRLDR
jgi:hypothetical protein